MLGEVQGYRIFVGGLSWDVTERQLEDAFSPFGKILDCQVIYFACIFSFFFQWVCCLILKTTTGNWC